MSGPDKAKPGTKTAWPTQRRGSFHGRESSYGQESSYGKPHNGAGTAPKTRAPSSLLLARKGAASAQGFDRISNPAPTMAAPVSASSPVIMKRVLIVEDDELSMKLFCDLIRVRGHLVLTAMNGEDALRLAREQRPDLILMDMQLPDVSGLRVTRMIKNDENLKSTPVIAITSYVSEHDQETIRNGGCDDYIAKPISLSGFSHVMEKFLG